MIAPVSSVIWFFRNHSNMLICSLRTICYYNCCQQLCCLIFLWKLTFFQDSLMNWKNSIYLLPLSIYNVSLVNKSINFFKKKKITDPKHILFIVYYMERRRDVFFMIPNTICSLNWYVVLELTLHHVICVSVWHVGVAVLICCHGIVPGEWCKPAQCNPWAGCCCTEEGWTDGDHYCPVQTRR